MLYDNMLDAIGHTPLVRLDIDAPDGVEVFAKLELQNPFAIKDRVALNIVRQAKRSGRLADGAAIVESSSGTMALGLALVGTALGHPVHIVTDPRIDPVTLAKLHALGCEVHIVQAMNDQGWQGARLDRLDEVMAGNPGAFWPQQYSNPDNPAAYGALAAELLDDLGRLDVLVAAVGSGGTLCGTSRALRVSLPDLRVVGVDGVGSVLFGQPDRPGRLQSGLGNSLHPANLDPSLIDEVHWLSDAEAFTSTRELAREQKIFAGNTSGSVYRVLRHVAAQAQPGSRVVGIFPDRGDRYVESVYSSEFWAGRELVDAPYGAVAAHRVRPGTVVSDWSYRVDKPGTAMVFVESNTTGTGMIALRRAAGLGLSPVLLTSDPARYRGLAETGCAVIRCDTNDTAALSRVVRERFRASDLAGITTTGEFYLSAVAALAEEFGVVGNDVAAVARCRDKAGFRRALATVDLPVPRFRVISAATELASAVLGVGLPCVVKPVDESGSTGVRLCTTVSEASEHAAALLATRVNGRGQPSVPAVLVEEYLDGPEYSVELFVSDGVPELVGITAKTVCGAPNFLEERHVYPAPVGPDVAGELFRAAVAATTAAGIGVGAVHVEVRLTARGAVVIEVNARLAGGMIPDLVRLAGGPDLVEQQVRAFAGLPVDLGGEPTGVAGIQFLMPDRSGTLTRVHGTAAAERVTGVERVVLTVDPGRWIAPPLDAMGRIGYVIATGACHDEVTERLAQAVSHIVVEVSNDEWARSRPADRTPA